MGFYIIYRHHSGAVSEHWHTGTLGDAPRINPETGLTYVPINKAGDSMVGYLTLNEEPVEDKHASTKHYVDAATESISKIYIHEQEVPLDVWTVEHNLDIYPSVTVVDSAGSVVIGELTYVSRNELLIKFTSSFAGRAFLN
jgi:hypothetical protein